MAYRIYVPKTVELEAETEDGLRFRVDYEQVERADTMERTLEISVSVARAYFGDAYDPSIRLEYGARGTLTEVILFHLNFRPITLPNGTQPLIFPAVLVRLDKNPEQFSRYFGIEANYYRFYNGNYQGVGV